MWEEIWPCKAGLGVCKATLQHQVERLFWSCNSHGQQEQCPCLVLGAGDECCLSGNDLWTLHRFGRGGSPSLLHQPRPLLCSGRVPVPAVVEQVKLQTLQFRSCRLQLQDSKGKRRSSALLSRYAG